MNEYIILTIIGLVVGIIGGLLGGGADVLLVPLLLMFGISKNIKNAIGISLSSLLPPIGIFAVYQFYKNKNINKSDILKSFYIAVCFTIASYISSKYAVNEKNDILKKIYAVFLIIIGIISFKY
jgi:uncharacterized protein